jgi:hypothetical protein
MDRDASKLGASAIQPFCTVKRVAKGRSIRLESSQRDPGFQDSSMRPPI